MIKEVDLVSYLPPFMAKYKEISLALEAENPEFHLVWEAANRVLLNEFFATADECGISRFEKILNIFPSKEDTLESRRARVQARWFKGIPYTFNVLIERLNMLCGEGNFTVEKKYENYEIVIFTHLPLCGQVEELDALLSYIAPANFVIKAINTLSYAIQSTVNTAGVAVENRAFTVDSKTEKGWELDATVTYGAAITQTLERVIDTKDAVLDKKYNLSASILNGSTVVKTIEKTIK